MHEAASLITDASRLSERSSSLELTIKKRRNSALSQARMPRIAYIVSPSSLGSSGLLGGGSHPPGFWPTMCSDGMFSSG